MPKKPFTLAVPCPPVCAQTPGEACKFEIDVSWDEVEDTDGFIYAKNLVVELLPEVGTGGCAGDFHAGLGGITFTPKGGQAVTVDGNNVWDQQREANGMAGYAKDSPGGADVQYRDPNNKPDPTKKGGEPYKISYTKGLIESFKVDFKIKCQCICKTQDMPKTQNVQDLEVKQDFTRSKAAKKNGGGWFG
jgi:hypothetical protein